MRADDAISRINSIHSMLNSTAIFRGYRSQATLASAVLAVLAALIQSAFMPDPASNLMQYLGLWGSVAVFSLGLSGWHLWKSYDPQAGSIERAKYRSALMQLCPGLAAGAGLTIVICSVAVESVWMLPGLWSVCFGLAVCSSAAILPKGTLFGGMYFIVAGLLVLFTSNAETVLAPWTMVVTFALGQTINAILLYWTLERPKRQREPQR